MADINDIGAVVDLADQYLKSFEALPIPMLVEHFREAIEGDPVRVEEAELFLAALKKFVERYGKKHNGCNGAYFFALALFFHNMLAVAAHMAAQYEESQMLNR
jgi:hypothetical protein